MRPRRVTNLSEPSDAVLDRLDARLSGIRDLPGLPSLPAIESVTAEVKQVVELVPPSAVDPYTVQVFDPFIDNKVEAAFGTWRQHVQRHHDQVLGELDSLAAAVSDVEATTGQEEARGEASVHLAEAKIRAVLSHALDPDQPVFGPAAATATNPPAGPPPAAAFDATDLAHGDPGTLVGRHWTGWLYVVVLVVAAGVDIATFYQVFALVVYNVPEWVVWIGVVGFTVTALSLAHAIGVQARRRAAEHRRVLTSPGAWLCLVVWIFVGATAFVVRGLAPPPLGGDQSEILVDGAAASASAGPQSWLPALLFLALYLATGAVAATGAFQRHNPSARRYETAAAGHAAATKQAALAGGTAARARMLTSAVQAERQRRVDELATALQAGDAFKATLTQWAQLWLVALKGDPTFTKAQTTDTN